jgi:adenylate cyclase class 2
MIPGMVMGHAGGPVGSSWVRVVSYGGQSEVYEVELKFHLADAAALENRLVRLAARFRDPIEQIDRYFAHPCRDFARTDEAVRLRQVGDHVELTWKGPRTDAAAKTRREIELALPSPTVPSGDAAAATIARWTELLEALGFRRVMEVAKRRRPARVVWQGTEVEVAIDRVTGLGDFVELEIRAEQGEVPLAQACLQSLAQELGCSSPERRSYLELILQSNVAR